MSERGAQEKNGERGSENERERKVKLKREVG